MNINRENTTTRFLFKLLFLLPILLFLITNPSYSENVTNSTNSTNSKTDIFHLFKDVYLGEVVKNSEGTLLKGVNFTFSQECNARYGCVYQKDQFLYKTGAKNKYNIYTLAVAELPDDPDSQKDKYTLEKPYAHTNWFYKGNLVTKKDPLLNIPVVLNEKRLIKEAEDNFMNHPPNVKQFIYDYLRDRYYDDERYFEAFNIMVDKLLNEEQPEIIKQIFDRYLTCINYKELNLGDKYKSIADCMNKNNYIDYDKVWPVDVRDQPSNLRFKITAKPFKLITVELKGKKFEVPFLYSLANLVKEGFLADPVVFYYYEPVNDSYGYNVYIHYYVMFLVQDKFAKGTNSNYIFYHFIVKRNMGDFISKKLSSWSQEIDGNIAEVSSSCSIKEDEDYICLECEGYVKNNVQFPLTYDIEGKTDLKWRKLNVIEGFDEREEMKKESDNQDGTASCSWSGEESTEGGRQQFDIDYDTGEWHEDSDELDKRSVVLGPGEKRLVVSVRRCISTYNLRKGARVCRTSTLKSCEYKYPFFQDLQAIPGEFLTAYICGAVRIGDDLIKLNNKCPVLPDGEELYEEEHIKPEGLELEGNVYVTAHEKNTIFDGYGVQGGSSSDSASDVKYGEDAESLDCDEYTQTFIPPPPPEEDNITNNESQNNTTQLNLTEYPDYDPKKYNKRVTFFFPIEVTLSIKNSSVWVDTSIYNTVKYKMDYYMTLKLLYGVTFLTSSNGTTRGINLEIPIDHRTDSLSNNPLSDSTYLCMWDTCEYGFIIDKTPVASCNVKVEGDKVVSVSCENSKIKNFLDTIRSVLWSKHQTPLFLSAYGAIDAYTYIDNKVYQRLIENFKNVDPSKELPNDFTPSMDNLVRLITTNTLIWGSKGPSPGHITADSSNWIVVMHPSSTNWAYSKGSVESILEGSYTFTSPLCIVDPTNDNALYGCIETFSWGSNKNAQINDIEVGNAQDLGLSSVVGNNPRFWTCMKSSDNFGNIFFICFPRIAATKKTSGTDPLPGISVLDSDLYDPSKQNIDSLNGIPLLFWSLGKIYLPVSFIFAQDYDIAVAHVGEVYDETWKTIRLEVSKGIFDKHTDVLSFKIDGMNSFYFSPETFSYLPKRYEGIHFKYFYKKIGYFVGSYSPYQDYIYIGYNFGSQDRGVAVMMSSTDYGNKIGIFAGDNGFFDLEDLGASPTLFLVSANKYDLSVPNPLGNKLYAQEVSSDDGSVEFDGMEDDFIPEDRVKVAYIPSSGRPSFLIIPSNSLIFPIVSIYSKNIVSQELEVPNLLVGHYLKQMVPMKILAIGQFSENKYSYTEYPTEDDEEDSTGWVYKKTFNKIGLPILGLDAFENQLLDVIPGEKYDFLDVFQKDLYNFYDPNKAESPFPTPLIVGVIVNGRTYKVQYSTTKDSITTPVLYRTSSGVGVALKVYSDTFKKWEEDLSKQGADTSIITAFVQKYAKTPQDFEETLASKLTLDFTVYDFYNYPKEDDQDLVFFDVSTTRDNLGTIMEEYEDILNDLEGKAPYLAHIAIEGFDRELFKDTPEVENIPIGGELARWSHKEDLIFSQVFKRSNYLSLSEYKAALKRHR